MKNKLFLTICLAVLGIYFVFSPSVFADSWQNEYIHNGTGQTATNLEKWLDGNVLVSDHLGRACFSDFSYGYDATHNWTKCRWYNGSVPDSTHCCACLKTDKDKIKHRYLPRWSFAKSDSIIAGPALSHQFVEFPKAGKIDVVLANTAADGGAITISTIKVGVVKPPLRISQLDPDSLASVNWIITEGPDTIPLDTAAIDPPLRFEVPNPPKGSAVVYWASDVYLNSAPSNVVQYVGQYAEQRQTPTLTQWGVIILVALLIGSTVFIMLRRRKTVPA
jgi:hypothetical protein